MTDAGALDDELDLLVNELDLLVNAVRARRQALALEKTADLKVGDAVRFTENTRPQYLRGVTGVFQGRNENGKLLVDVDPHPSAGRFAGSKGVRCSDSMIEKVG